MATKISKTMGEQLVKALGNPSYEMVGARTNTERAMHARGLVFHGRLREPVLDSRGHQVRTHGMMLTDEGVKEAQRLQAEGAEERGEEPQAAEVTREDVARGVDDALQWLHFGDRDAARARGAVRVLTVEFSRARRVMRKLLGSGRYEVEAQAVEYYGRVRALLAAAKRFEVEDAADNASEVSARFAAVQSGAVVEEKGMEDMSEQEHASAFGERFAKAQQERQEAAQERTGVTRGNGGTDEYGYPDRIPTLFVDGGSTYRLVPFAPAGVVEEAGAVLAHNAHTGLKITERYVTGTAAGVAVAWRVDGQEWEPFGKGGKYLVRAEERGHGVVAVYVKASANDVNGATRAAAAYARNRLTFEPGLSGGAVSGGGEFADAGATYIAQEIFATRRAPARQD